MEEQFKKILEQAEIKNVKKEFVNKVVTLIIAALGVIAALSWNETLQFIFRQLFGEHSTILARVLYSLGVTLIAVVLSVILGKLFLQNSEKK